MKGRLSKNVTVDMPKSTLHYFHFVLLLTRDTCSDAKSYVRDKDGIQKMNFCYSVDVIFKDAGGKRHLKLCELSLCALVILHLTLHETITHQNGDVISPHV